MSYARFGEDSDVYVLGMLASEGYHCLSCRLTKKEGFFHPVLNRVISTHGSFTAKTPYDMTFHLFDHMHEGHKVPMYALRRLGMEDNYLRKIGRGTSKCLHIKR